MSIIHSYDDSEELLKASFFHQKKEGFPSDVITVFTKDALDGIIDSTEAQKIDFLMAGSYIPIYKIQLEKKAVAIYQTPIGGAAAAGLLEEMIAKGGKRFLYFGSCGTLDQSIAAGHFILPTSAYRDEGVSYHYAPPQDYIDIKSYERLKEVFMLLNIPYISGKTWTTDAFYRETKNQMALRKEEGCIAVEMECASIMSVADFRNVSVYQYLYAEDTLDGTKWDPRTMGNVTANVFDQYGKIAMKIMNEL